MSFTRTKREDKSAYCWQYSGGRMTVSVKECTNVGDDSGLLKFGKNEMALIVISIHYRFLTLFDKFFFASELELIQIGN